MERVYTETKQLFVQVLGEWAVSPPWLSLFGVGLYRNQATLCASVELASLYVQEDSFPKLNTKLCHSIKRAPFH